MTKDLESLLEAEKITTLMVDLDNSLWQGTIGDEQVPVLNQDFYDYLRTAYSKGIQIFVVSKNDEDEVLRWFERVGIDPDIFIKVVANLEPKYLNVERIIEATCIRPETVVYIDDNPAERAEVKATMPAIYCIDAKDWKVLLDVPYLKDKKRQTKSEIEERYHRYQTAIDTASLTGFKAEEDPDFLRRLNREISIGPVGVEGLDKIARLLYTTHRLNFTPNDFPDYETTRNHLHDRLNAGDQLIAVSAYQSGLDLGLTGALIIHRENKRAQILKGTFSCGILGRGFEQKTLLTLAEQWKNEGLDYVDIDVSLTSTNQRIQQILEEIGFRKEKKEGKVLSYCLSLKDYQPTEEYDWIRVRPEAPSLEYLGIPSVLSFFEEHVMPLMRQGSRVINLGAGRGEVLGHLEEDIRDEFYRFIKERGITYSNVDMEYYREEDNIVGNAENLTGIIETGSQDIVLAIELLEHTEHPWQVINEMTRICTEGGYIFVTVPSNAYPKHEYPIDRWRVGPETIVSFFPKPYFETIRLETEGSREMPWRTMIVVRKLMDYEPHHAMPENGKTNWKTGLTIFP